MEVLSTFLNAATWIIAIAVIAIFILPQAFRILRELGQA